MGEIAAEKDPEQKISGVETFLGLFTEASEQELAVPVLVDGYQAAKRWDDAFGLAPRVLAKNSGNVVLLTQLAIGGTDLARTGKKDYYDQTKQYAAQAIALMEADKKPSDTKDDEWAAFKKQWIPQLYQSQGLLFAIGGNPPDARASYLKASALNPVDPYNYYLLGVVVDDEYQQLAKQYKVTPSGPAQEAMLKNINGKLDEVIDLYARAVGLSEGKPAYQGMHDQVLEGLRAYYKFRKGSLDGLPALIDKYKK